MRPCATLMVATLERSPSTKVLQVTSADCTTRRAVMIRTCDGDSDAGLREETWTVAMESLMVATLGRNASTMLPCAAVMVATLGRIRRRRG